MHTPTLLALLAGICAAAAPAQQCAPGSVLLKNDSLPDVPPANPTAVAVVPGLCTHEAAMAVLDTGGGAVAVEKVSVMFAAQLGTNGITAAVDLEIYDGATANANGTYTLGPLLFKLSSSGSNLQVQSHALNEYTLPASANVVATSGKVVVGFRMVQNTASGSCATGYSANFATDATGFASCATKAGENVLDALGHGPVDPAVYNGFGLPLCPRFFNGQWIIRACVKPQVSVTWTGNPTPGGVISLSFIAPNHGNESFLVIAGGDTTPTPLPWGTIPLNLADALTQCFFGPCRGAMLISPANGLGVLDASGNAPGGMLIPNLAVLVGSGLRIYVAFITSPSPAMFPWSAVSAPSTAIVIH